MGKNSGHSVDEGRLSGDHAPRKDEHDLYLETGNFSTGIERIKTFSRVQESGVLQSSGDENADLQQAEDYFMFG